MNNELAKMATDRGMYYIDTHDFLADNADYLDAAYALSLIHIWWSSSSPCR